MPEASTRLMITSFEEAAALADRIGRLCSDLPGSDPDAVDALRLGLAQALNIVAHGYGGAPGRSIHAELRATPDGCEVLLTDEGAPMPDGNAPGMRRETGIDPDPGDLATPPEASVGWAVIHARLDDVDYRRRYRRNLLRLAKPLAKPLGPAP